MLHLYVYVYVYICIYICYICMCVYIYIYIYIYYICVRMYIPVPRASPQGLLGGFFEASKGGHGGSPIVTAVKTYAMAMEKGPRFSDFPITLQ